MKFGRWTVVGSDPTPHRFPKIICVCDCGVRRSVTRSQLRNGASKSCGCYSKDVLRARMHALTEWDNDFPGEVWRPVPCAIRGENLEASTCGRIRNAETRHVYRGTPDEKGYLRVSINKKLFRSHILVAKAFHPNPTRLPEVNHKDGVKSNPRPDNLEWCTHQGNMEHAWAIGLMQPLIGEDNGASKLTEEQVLKIRHKYKPGLVRQVDLAVEFGVSQRMISLIVRREKWTHV